MQVFMLMQIISIVSLSGIVQGFQIHDMVKKIIAISKGMSSHDVCPKNMKSCIQDKTGYKSMKSLFTRMDINKDGFINSQEIIQLFQISKDDLITRSRPMTGIFGVKNITDTKFTQDNVKEKSIITERNIDFEHIWANWISLEKYKWNKINLGTMMKLETNNTLLRSLFYNISKSTDEITGRDLVRLADSSDELLKSIMDISKQQHDEKTLESFRKLLILNIFFGDIDSTNESYTRVSLWCIMIIGFIFLIDPIIWSAIVALLNKMEYPSILYSLAEQMQKID